MEKSVKFTHTGHSHAIGNFSAGDVFRGSVEMCRHFVEDAMCAQWEDAPAGDALLVTPPLVTPLLVTPPLVTPLLVTPLLVMPPLVMPPLVMPPLVMPPLVTPCW